MRKEIISIIRVLGICVDEVIIEISIEDILFNSIEWDRENDIIFLHKFIGDLDFIYNYDDLTKKQKSEIYYFLLREMN